MTPEQQRVKIAVLCNVQTIYFRFWHLSHGGYKWWNGLKSAEDANRTWNNFGDKDRPVEEYVESRFLPDYLNSLDAMAEAEKTLTTDELHAYYERLEIALGWEYPSASAEDRAKYFLKVKGAWE